MRKFIIVAVVLVIAGVGASFLLIPSKKDVVTMQARDLRTVATGQVDVEAEYNAGRRSFPIISALADKRVTEGNRPAAIQILEDYVKANPTDIQGHKKLAEQYQLAGRQADYNAQLEQIAAAEPTEANLRILSDIYNADKNYPKQVEVLKKIVAVTNGGNAQTFVDLATIQVVVGDKDGALATLAELKTKHPEFSSYPVVRIQVSILSEKGQADQAFDIAKQWIDTPHPALTTPQANVPPSATPKAVVTAPVPAQADQMAKELADLCNILHYSGHADKAVALVEPHIDLLQQSTELVVAYVNANITAGRDEHAYQILTKIDDAGRMTPELYIPYMQLAIKREDIAKAEAIATKLDTTPFNEEQSLNLIETARANNAPTVTAILLDRFNTPQFLQGKPVLTAVIGILKNEKDQDKKIEVALNTQLSSIQRVRLAEACARASKTQCFDAIVKQYPPIEQMTTQQISEYAQLYIIANRPTDVIDAIGAQAVKPNAHPDVQDAHRRLAAAAGREDIMKPWLEANANNAPVIKLQEYFYLANDRHQHKVATDIAERMYARDPSPMSRDLMIAAFMDAGDYAKALPYLREQIKQEGTSDGAYVTALSKLARKDKAARKELTDYSLASLQSNKGDSRTQLNYAYALINNGERAKALPFAKQYSTERGGEWKKMYAQLTMKPAKGGTATAAAPKMTREQMVAMAHNPSINATNKRQIAFQLLHDGYKPDATAIFAELAKDKGPDSQEVKDLLYMWGGKLNAEQIAWVQSRAANASAYDKQRWGDLINNSADDYAVLQYVSATPDSLYNKNLRQRYFRVLATQRSGENFDAAMRGWVSQTTDVPALTDYAQAAMAHNFKDAATATWQRILVLDPNNEMALNELSATSYAKGSYSYANQYLDRYMSVVAANPQPQTNPAQAYFYKASLLKRQGNIPAAQQAFSQVIRLTPVNEGTPADALSRVYTAEFNIGQHAAAKAGFEQLLAQHPNDKGILADYMSALIEFKYYDDATRIANQYDKSSPYYHQSALTGISSHVAQIERLSGGRELKISFDQPIEGEAPIQVAANDQPEWMESSTVGYDSLTVSAKPGYVVRYVPTAAQQFAVVGTPAESMQMAAFDRDQELRLQLLYAQIEQQTGQNEKAKQRIAALQQYYPQDTQLMTTEAGVELADGNNYRAIQLLERAHTQAPENEEIASLMRALRRVDSKQFVKIDNEYRKYGSSHENITTLSGVAKVGDRTEVGISIANDYLAKASGIGIGAVKNKNRQSAELFLAQYLDNGARLQGSLFGSGAAFGSGTYQDEKTFGAGAYYAFNNPLGRTELLGEYHKPYWDFPGAVINYATRDRVGAKHYANIDPRWALGIEASVNNYNIETGDLALPDSGRNVTQSGLLRLSTSYELQHQTPKQPYFGVGYGFDGEYLMHQSETIPFTHTREIHQVTGIYRDDWTPATHALFDAGWVYDRYTGNNGPVVEGRIDQDLSDAWEAGLRGRYSQVSTEADSSAINLGADLMYKF